MRPILFSALLSRAAFGARSLRTAHAAFYRHNVDRLVGQTRFMCGCYVERDNHANAGSRVALPRTNVEKHSFTKPTQNKAVSFQYLELLYLAFHLLSAFGRKPFINFTSYSRRVTTFLFAHFGILRLCSFAIR